MVDKYDLSSLKYMLSGAAPLGPDLQRRLQDRLKCWVTQAYGMTESWVPCCKDLAITRLTTRVRNQLADIPLRSV